MCFILMNDGRYGSIACNVPRVSPTSIVEPLGTSWAASSRPWVCRAGVASDAVTFRAAAGPLGSHEALLHRGLVRSRTLPARRRRDSRMMKILFVGLGSIGQRHLRNLQRLGGFEYVALRSTRSRCPTSSHISRCASSPGWRTPSPSSPT